MSAVKSGTISETRVDEAVQRVLHLKRGIAPVPGDIDRAAHCQLAQQIASRALRLERTVPSLQGQTLALFAPKIVQGAIEESSLLTLGAQTLSVFFEGLNPSEQEAALMQEMAQQADRVIFCSYNAWKNTAQADLIRSLLKQKSVIAIVLGDPLDTALFSGADCTLTTFSPTAPSLQAACTLLKP